jgi:hypothetical protein
MYTIKNTTTPSAIEAQIAVTGSIYSVVPKLSTLQRRVLNIAYNTTVVKYARVNTLLESINLGI